MLTLVTEHRVLGSGVRQFNAVLSADLCRTYHQVGRLCQPIYQTLLPVVCLYSAGRSLIDWTAAGRVE